MSSVSSINTINNIKNINNISKTISNNSTLGKSSKDASTGTSTVGNLVSNIVSKVKDNANKNLRMYLVIVVPILFFLFYLLYKYNLNSRSQNIIASMDYKSQLPKKIKGLDSCYQVDITQQFKLCDYYISSSFMTPCVGNQHYDYISDNMILEVLQSGARYIQIPICEADVTLQALPVIGTAVYGQRVITSLNTLDIRTTFKLIHTNAFKVNNNNVNYPLIIHLVLNTNNAYTLDSLADIIKEIFSDILIDVSKYETYPIYLEKLCNLLGKIIIIATPEYIGTSLEPFIVPTMNLFEIYHFSELGQLNMSDDSIYKNVYNQKLSSKQQTESNEKFNSKYPSLDYIIKNISTIGQTIINDSEILNNLTCFNKFGMSVIKPQYQEDVISKNYDFAESVYYGCQFVTMNFQINDINMKNYIAMFSDSSFRLKPSSMRFSEKEEPIQDLLNLYKNVETTNVNTNIISNFFDKYNNSLISIKSYVSNTSFLSEYESNLKFNIGTNQTKDKLGNITSYNVDLNQTFIPRKSKLSSSGNISICLESANMPNYFITLSGNTFTLQRLSTKTKELNSQSFYIEKPTDAVTSSITDTTDSEGEMINMKIVDSNKPMYLVFENNQVKAYANKASSNNMTFLINKVPFKYVIKIITLYDGSFKTMSGNIIGVLENNTSDGTPYYVIPTNSNSTSNFNMFKDTFVLQNKYKNTYVTYDSNTFFLYDRETNPNQNSVFTIQQLNGYYTLLNKNNETIILYNKNLIKFTKKENVDTNENLFKLVIDYEIS